MDCKPFPQHPARTAPLNVLQRAMRNWSQLAPYNVVVALECERPVPPRELAEAAAEIRVRDGLERIEIVCDSPADALTDVIAAEHARSFADSDPPVRLFVHGNFVGAVFEHCSFDARTGLRLLAGAAARCEGRSAVALRLRPDAHPPIRPFLQRPWSSVLGLIARARRMTRCHCPWSGERSDFRVGVRLLPLDPAVPQRLRAHARTRRCTVHDVLLAAAADAVSSHLPITAGSRRTDIAVGGVADLRGRHPGLSPRSGGMPVAPYSVECPREELRSFPRLLQHVRRRMDRLRRDWRAEVGWLDLHWLEHAWPRLSPGERARFVSNNWPIAAGVSAPNVTDELEAVGIRVRRVYNFAPVGPATPLMFTVGVGGAEWGVAAIHRVAGYPEPIVAAACEAFVRRLSTLG